MLPQVWEPASGRRQDMKASSRLETWTCQLGDWLTPWRCLQTDGTEGHPSENAEYENEDDEHDFNFALE